MSIYMSSDMKVIGREGNTVLEWLGDVGGLSEALIWIGFLLTGSFGQARMIALLTNRLFKDDSLANVGENLNSSQSPGLPKTQRSRTQSV